MREHERLENKANLSKGIDDCQNIIDQLKSARGTIEAGKGNDFSCPPVLSTVIPYGLLIPLSIISDASSAQATLKRLEPTVKKSFDKVNDDLKEIYNALGKYSKAVEKVCHSLAILARSC